MEESYDSKHDVIKELKDYAETRLRLVAYQGVQKGTSVAADIIAGLAVVCCYLLTFFFASITLGLYLAELFHSGWAGFGGLAGVYLLIAIVIIIFKKRFERPVMNVFITKLLK